MTKFRCSKRAKAPTAAVLAAVSLLSIPAAASGHELSRREAANTARSIARFESRDSSYLRGVHYRVVHCDRQSDHAFICNVKIWNIHERIDIETFGPSYRQACFGEILVKYVSSRRRQIGVSQDWNCESNHE